MYERKRKLVDDLRELTLRQDQIAPLAAPCERTAQVGVDCIGDLEPVLLLNESMWGSRRIGVVEGCL